MKENFIQFFRVHFLGGARYRENQKVVIQFCQSCGKSLEQDISRFSYCASHHTFLLGKCVDRGKVPE